jgi:hypothetical protein
MTVAGKMRRTEGGLEAVVIVKSKADVVADE